jgi:hypothetical protein
MPALQEKEPFMSQHPGRAQGAQQESEGNEASPTSEAPQVSQGQSPQEKQEFYWRRQAEKLEKEMVALRAEREAEVSRVSRDREEATARATEAEWRAERLSLFAQSNLPSELLDLVPEGEPELVRGYLEKLRPIAEKLSRPAPRGFTNTNPPNPAGGDEARLQRLAGEAARGDRRALREYAHLREKVRPNH